MVRNVFLPKSIPSSFGTRYEYPQSVLGKKNNVHPLKAPVLLYKKGVRGGLKYTGVFT